MQLPETLQLAIDQAIQNCSPTALRKAREETSAIYKTGRNIGSVFNDEGKRLAYLGARMPATYAAVYDVLKRLLECLPSVVCNHFLDLGAGPGTASWAAAEIFPDLKKFTLIERSPEAISLGRMISRDSALQEAEWIQKSLIDMTHFPDADLAMFSYVLGELSEPEKAIEVCWNSQVPIIAIVEPGTPKGFDLIRKLRDGFIRRGAHIVAPCPHANTCPIQGKDWCHFSTRIERTRLHRMLKEGTLGFEDEKFSYLIVSKYPVQKCSSRIVRQPQKLSGHVRMTLCSEEKIEEKVITRSSKEVYRKARDAEWGDSWM